MSKRKIGPRFLKPDVQINPTTFDSLARQAVELGWDVGYIKLYRDVQVYGAHNWDFCKNPGVVLRMAGFGATVELVKDRAAILQRTYIDDAGSIFKKDILEKNRITPAIVDEFLHLHKTRGPAEESIEATAFQWSEELGSMYCYSRWDSGGFILRGNFEGRGFEEITKMRSHIGFVPILAEANKWLQLQKHRKAQDNLRAKEAMRHKMNQINHKLLVQDLKATLTQSKG